MGRVITISGGMGSGKTTILTLLAYIEFRKNGRKVFSNYKLNFPFEPISLNRLLNFNLNNCFIALDEGYIYLDSHHRNKLSTLISYFVQQSRKRDVTFATTTQRIMNLDARLRDIANMKIYCQGIPNNVKPQAFQYTFWSDSGDVWQKTVNKERLKGIFKLFDTNEVFNIIDAEVEKKRAKGEVEAWK